MSSEHNLAVQTKRLEENAEGVLCSRENIRRQLASDEKEEPELTSNNLLLCFLNETPSDLESEEEVEVDDDVIVPVVEAKVVPTATPPNHSLATLLKNTNGWQSEDSSSDDDESLKSSPKTHQNISLERVNTSRTVIEGNISRKKGHVIIPLRCSSEAAQVLEQSPPPPPATANNQLEDAFFQQLAVIQAETRRQLREAKNIAGKQVESERCEFKIKDDIDKLLVQNSDSQLRNFSGYSTRKLNRHILTPMNVSQLQVILNYLLTQIETLNENLVQYLITRDELAIEQDSLLTDIEDITKCIQGHDMSPF